jgi:hypothetical protein
VPEVDLKPLPKGLKYEFLGPDKTYPVIVSDELSPEENEKLLNLLKKHRKVIGVNTKNWSRKGADLWAELVTKYHSAGKISSEDSVKVLAVGTTPSFGKRTVCACKRKFSGMRGDVARYKEGTS